MLCSERYRAIFRALCRHDYSRVRAVLQEVYYTGCAIIDTRKPKSERKFNVPAIRSENLPHKVFHSLLTSGGFGILNQAKTFMGKREKATLLYLNGLTVEEIVKGAAKQQMYIPCCVYTSE